MWLFSTISPWKTRVNMFNYKPMKNTCGYVQLQTHGKHVWLCSTMKHDGEHVWPWSTINHREQVWPWLTVKHDGEHVWPWSTINHGESVWSWWIINCGEHVRLWSTINLGEQAPNDASRSKQNGLLFYEIGRYAYLNIVYSYNQITMQEQLFSSTL